MPKPLDEDDVFDTPAEEYEEQPSRASPLQRSEAVKNMVSELIRAGEDTRAAESS